MTTACSLSNDRIFDRDSQTLLEINRRSLLAAKILFRYEYHFSMWISALRVRNSFDQSKFHPFFFEWYRGILNCICIFLHILCNSFSTNVSHKSPPLFLRFSLVEFPNRQARRFLPNLALEIRCSTILLLETRQAESRALEAFLGRRKVPKKKVFSLRRVSRGLQEDRWLLRCVPTRILRVSRLRGNRVSNAGNRETHVNPFFA